MNTWLFVLFCTISSGYAYYRRQEICSNISVSNLPDVLFNEDLVGRGGRIKIWYSHLLIDDTNVIEKDAKLIYQREKGGRTLQEFFIGLSNDRSECTITQFRDSQTIPDRPCVLSKQIVPASSEPAGEYIYAFLDQAKTVLLFYKCVNYNQRRQICETVNAIAVTTRPSLRRGERDLFLRTLRDFGTDLSVSIVEDQFSADNNCEEPVLRLLRRRQFQRKPRRNQGRFRNNRRRTRVNRRRKIYRY